LARRFLSHWRGVLLSLIGVVAVIWLAVSGQLGLYIHPRYFVFTVIMAVIAAFFVLAAFALVPGTPIDAESHEDASAATTRTRSSGWWGATSLVLVTLTAAALLVLPPATLTTSTVQQRDINGSATARSADETVDLVGADTSSFTVKDWSGLLRQGADEQYLSSKTPTVVGFVTADSDDPANVFYVARFVVTCCAVDAQPVGVPVYLPGWQDDYDTDEWVSVTGSFIANPSVSSAQPIVLSPEDISPTDQPAQPYVY
jgi:uncharacterized repeat protein (TIGR03943 family)